MGLVRKMKTSDLIARIVSIETGRVARASNIQMPMQDYELAEVLLGGSHAGTPDLYAELDRRIASGETRRERLVGWLRAKRAEVRLAVLDRPVRRVQDRIEWLLAHLRPKPLNRWEVAPAVSLRDLRDLEQRVIAGVQQALDEKQ